MSHSERHVEAGNLTCAAGERCEFIDMVSVHRRPARNQGRGNRKCTSHRCRTYRWPSSGGWGVGTSLWTDRHVQDSRLTKCHGKGNIGDPNPTTSGVSRGDRWKPEVILFSSNCVWRQVFWLGIGRRDLKYCVRISKSRRGAKTDASHNFNCQSRLYADSQETWTSRGWRRVTGPMLWNATPTATTLRVIKSLELCQWISNPVFTQSCHSAC